MRLEWRTDNKDKTSSQTESSIDLEEGNIGEHNVRKSKDKSSKDDDSITSVSDIDQRDNEYSEEDDAFLARFDEDGNNIG